MKFKELKETMHRSVDYRIMLLDEQKPGDMDKNYDKLNVVEIARSPSNAGPGVLIYLSKKDRKQIELDSILGKINQLREEKEIIEQRIVLLQQKYVENGGENL